MEQFIQFLITIDLWMFNVAQKARAKYYFTKMIRRIAADEQRKII